MAEPFIPNSGHDGPDAANGPDLTRRVVSAALLAPLAIGAAYLGGWFFLLFWTAAAAAVWWEWMQLVDGDTNRTTFHTGLGALGLGTLLTGIGRPGLGFLILLLGGLAAAATTRTRPSWIASGVVYAGLLIVAPAYIRGQSQGFAGILFLFGVVWTTDIAGYFTGRALGGPKLAPAFSPQKTWSGMLGGTLGALLVGLAFALVHGDALTSLLFLALVLSLVAQAGDLFESKIKRHFGAKDASSLIPGHGGVMDRVDGFVAAAAALAVILMFHAPGRGLGLW